MEKKTRIQKLQQQLNTSTDREKNRAIAQKITNLKLNR